MCLFTSKLVSGEGSHVCQWFFSLPHAEAGWAAIFECCWVVRTSKSIPQGASEIAVAEGYNMFVQPLEIGTTKNSFPKCSIEPIQRYYISFTQGSPEHIGLRLRKANEIRFIKDNVEEGKKDRKPWIGWCGWMLAFCAKCCASVHFLKRDDGKQRSKASCSKLIRNSFHKWSSRSFAWDVYLQFRCPHYLKTHFPYRFLPKFLLWSQDWETCQPMRTF